MELQEIYQPIYRELNQVETELKTQMNLISKEQKFSDKIVEYFFNTRGKLLRPALVLLSAKSFIGQQTVNNESLIKLAAAVELIHSSSLIHDDIIDGSIHRRGQLVMNKKFNNKVAVLAGDMLYARAFSVLTCKLNTKIMSMISQCVERMCRGEINESNQPFSSFEEYLRIIEDKTAGFMSVCCRSGATVISSDKKVIEALGRFGHNFGMSYQVIDDYLDGDITFKFQADLVEKAKEYGRCAKENISYICDSKFKKSLENLTEYVTNKAQKDHSELINVPVL